jgi:CubicO group peptidase (beta-lactamase class C family)
MIDLVEAIDQLAGETGFSGVVRVDRAGVVELAGAYGLARRDLGIPNTIDTQFAIASGSKGLTAVTVISLIE